MYVNSLKHITHCIGKYRKIYGIEGNEDMDRCLARSFMASKFSNLDEYIVTELCNKWEEDNGTDK